MKLSDTTSLFKVAEIELVYRNPVQPENRLLVTHSKAAYEVLKASWDENRIELVEQFKIILLDRRGACLGLSEICSGGISTCLVDQRLIFITALKAKANSVILAHNHPSGNAKPSPDDLHITKRFVEAGKILGINITEHIILTTNSYFSFADNGLINP